MYTPEKFRVDDIAELQDFMRTYSFATIITVNDALPVVSHIPVCLDTKFSPYGKLSGHFARANIHWQNMMDSPATLVIFHGPHEYISPSWYEPKPMNVPTWNYMAVHAQGQARIVGEDELVMSLKNLVAENESGQTAPWILEVTPEMKDKLLPAIVGFEIELTGLEGKYKVSQNRMQNDQINVMQKLNGLQTPGARIIAERMKDNLGAQQS